MNYKEKSANIYGNQEHNNKVAEVRRPEKNDINLQQKPELWSNNSEKNNNLNGSSQQKQLNNNKPRVAQDQQRDESSPKQSRAGNKIKDNNGRNDAYTHADDYSGHHNQNLSSSDSRLNQEDED